MRATRSNRARLRSQGGKASAALRLTERLAAGSVTLPGERKPRRFTARAASGLAGLSEVTIAADGKATVTSQNANAAQLAGPHRPPALALQGRRSRRLPLIVQADGKTTGAKKGKQSASGSSGFVDLAAD